MSEAYHILLFCVIVSLFLGSLLFTYRGFKDESSWFYMVFSFGILTNCLFSFTRSLLGDDDLEWLVGNSEAILYYEITLIWLLFMIVGQVSVKGTQSIVRAAVHVSPLRLNESKLERYMFWLSFAGASLGILLSLIGVRGYFKDERYYYIDNGWDGPISYLISLTNAAFFITVLVVYRDFGKIRFSHYLLVASWMAAGMLSGYKSEMLFPVIFILLSSWLYGKTKVSHFVFAALAIVFAYSFIEPAREIADKSRGQTSALAVSIDTVASGAGVKDGLVPALLSRLDLTTTAVEVLEADALGQVESYKEAIREHLNLLPLIAVVPRAMWPEKPVEDFGTKLSMDLTGNPLNSLTPSPQVAAHLTGGYLLVAVYAYLYGWCLSIASTILYEHHRHPTLYLPIILLAFALSAGDAYLSVYLVKVVRMLIALTFIYMIMRAFSSKPAEVRLGARS